MNQRCTDVSAFSKPLETRTEMIKFVLLGLALSEELNVRISHGYTGYLFLSSDKRFECGLDLAQIGREACSGSFL